MIGGRGGRQNAYTATANYTFGGSALDAAPYQLRSDSQAGSAPYNRQNFGVTVGGPLKIRGIYDGTRKTNFMFSYSGNRGDDLFDQYATVPSDAMRAGNFSTASRQLTNPATGYWSGSVLNVDFAVSERFGRAQLGLAGFYATQIADDTQFGVPLAPDGRRAELLHLGYVLTYEVPEIRSAFKIKSLTAVFARNATYATGAVVSWVAKLD